MILVYSIPIENPKIQRTAPAIGSDRESLNSMDHPFEDQPLYLVDWTSRYLYLHMFDWV